MIADVGDSQAVLGCCEDEAAGKAGNRYRGAFCVIAIYLLAMAL